MLKTPQRQSEKVLFRDTFINETYVKDNGGVITGSPTIKNGVTTNGSTQLISYGDVGNLGDNDFTINLKVSFPSLVQTYIISKWQDNNNRWYVRRETAGQVFLYCLVGGAIQISAVSGVSLTTANKVYDISIVADKSDTIKFYVDGVQSTGSVSTFLNTNINNTGNLEVGRASTSYGAFTLNDLTIHDTALSTDEVLDYYQRDTFTEIDASKMEIALPLRTHYFDAGVSKEVTSNLGQINSDQIRWGDGSTVLTYPTLLENNGVSMDGGDSVRVPRTLSIAAGESYSFGALIQPIGNVANDYLFTLKDTDSNGLACYLNATTDALIFFGDNGGSSKLVSVAGMGPSKGLYHVACIYSFNGATYDYYVYVNGELAGSSLGKTGFTPSTGDVGFTLGCNELYTNGWAGTIRFPMLERVAWTPTQIKELSNQMFSNLNT